MTEQRELSSFWAPRGPLQSLSCAVLFIAASDRLSHALIVSLAVLFVYSTAPLLSCLAARCVPARSRRFLDVVSASAVSALAIQALTFLWPVPTTAVTFYLGAVPICLLASGLLESAPAAGPLRSVTEAALEGLVVSALTVAFALVREPLGYAALTLPAEGGYLPIFQSDGLQGLAPRVFSATAGSLVLLAYTLALFRVIRFRLYGVSLGEGGE